MVTVGVTGGIGSGKSTVCKVWEEMGAEVVYADKLAKELMTEDREVAHKIRSRFGDRSYHSDGTLNREYLAEQAFTNGRVEELNSIVHPVVRRKIKELIVQAARNGAEMFVQEAALLLSEGRPEGFDFIVAVTAKEEQRIEWVKKRDRADRNKVTARMEKQQPLNKLLPYCDFVIYNHSDLRYLKEEAAELYKKMIGAGHKQTGGNLE